MKKIILTVFCAVLFCATVATVSALPPVAGTTGGPIAPGTYSTPLNQVLTVGSGGYLGGSVKTKGGISVNALGTPTGCAVASTVGSGSTTWSYRVSALSATGETLACSAVSKTSKANTLSSTAYNTVTWTAVSGAYGYYVYRTAAGTTPSSTGRLGTGSCTPTVFTGTAAKDTGLCADSGTVLSTATDTQITGSIGMVLPATTANYVLAGPGTGSPAVPYFRAIVDADVPDTITASNYLPLAGGTMVGNLIFTDNSYDIGASGATRPRTGYFGTDVNVGGDVNVTDDVTCNQAKLTESATGITALANPTANTLVASDGILLQNTYATGTGQQFSPSLRLDGSGYTASRTQQTWAITNKPISATAGKIAFDFASAGGAYAGAMTVTNTGILAVDNYIMNYNAVTGTPEFYIGVPVSASGDVPASKYIRNTTSSIYFNGGAANGATAVGETFGTGSAYTTEGSRICQGTNNEVRKFAIDKDGVYHQGYASGTTTNGGTLALNLITTVDDDSIYKVEVDCIGAERADAPRFFASYGIVATVTRGKSADTNTTVRSNVNTLDYESDAACNCVLSASTNTILVTATDCGTGAAEYMNWKAFIRRMEKVSGASWGATGGGGVAQPAAN